MGIKAFPTLQSDITTLFADNTSGDITPLDLRTFLNDLVDSLRLRKSINTSIVSGVVTIDLSLGSHIYITLNENITTMNFNNPSNGQKIILELIQDATGGRTIVWPSSIRFSNDILSTHFVPSSASNSKSFFGLIYNEVNLKFDAVAFSRNH